MKKLIPVIVALFAITAFAAFPTLTKTYTVDASDVDGSWNSFNMEIPAGTDLAATFSFSDDGSGVNFTGVNSRIKVFRYSNIATSAVVYLTATNLTIGSGSNLTYTFSHTNDFGNKELRVEIYSWTGATTNTARTMAQGKLNVLGTVGP